MSNPKRPAPDLHKLTAERDALLAEVEALREQLRQAQADARFHGAVTR